MKTQDYKFFTRKLQGLAHKSRFPIRAIFELTYRCNFKCVHCYNTEEQKSLELKNELTTRGVFNILEQLRDLGTLYLGFTGGEIFLRKDILAIIQHARRLGFEVILLTNGSLIGGYIADKLKELMLNKVDITVHAIDRRIFDTITKTTGSAKRVFKAIEILHNRNIPLGLKSCGMQENKKEITKINEFARHLNALYRFDGEIFPKLNRSKAPLEYSISPEETYNIRKICYPEMFREYDSNGGKRRKVRFKRNLKRLFNCGAGRTDLTINPYGELNICIEIDYPRYKILEGSLKDGWQKIKDFVDNLMPPEDWACRSCDLTSYCFWCPAKGYLEDGNFSTCDPNSREHAQLIKNLEKS